MSSVAEGLDDFSSWGLVDDGKDKRLSSISTGVTSNRASMHHEGEVLDNLAEEPDNSTAVPAPKIEAKRKSTRLSLAESLSAEHNTEVIKPQASHENVGKSRYASQGASSQSFKDRIFQKALSLPLDDEENADENDQHDDECRKSEGKQTKRMFTKAVPRPALNRGSSKKSDTDDKEGMRIPLPRDSGSRIIQDKDDTTPKITGDLSVKSSTETFSKAKSAPFGLGLEDSPSKGLKLPKVDWSVKRHTVALHPDEAILGQPSPWIGDHSSRSGASIPFASHSPSAAHSFNEHIPAIGSERMRRTVHGAAINLGFQPPPPSSPMPSNNSRAERSRHTIHAGVNIPPPPPGGPGLAPPPPGYQGYSDRHSGMLQPPPPPGAPGGFSPVHDPHMRSFGHQSSFGSSHAGWQPPPPPAPGMQVQGGVPPPPPGMQPAPPPGPPPSSLMKRVSNVSSRVSTLSHTLSSSRGSHVLRADAETFVPGMALNRHLSNRESVASQIGMGSPLALVQGPSGAETCQYPNREDVPEWMEAGEEWVPEWAGQEDQASQQSYAKKDGAENQELGMEWDELFSHMEPAAEVTKTDQEDKRGSNVSIVTRKSLFDGALLNDDGDDDWAALMDGIIGDKGEAAD